MSRRVELVLIVKQEIVVLLRAKPTTEKGVPATVRVRYSEPRLNQLNRSIVRKVPWD
jgi:hypothetical protein